MATVTNQPWNGDASRFTDAQWQASCILDMGSGSTVKQRYKLPIREPSGAINTNALSAAAGALAGARTPLQAPADAKAAAAKALASAYRQAGRTPPPSLTR